MKKLSRCFAFVLAVLMLCCLCGCTGDPIPTSSGSIIGKVDISDAINYVTGGSLSSVSVSIRNGKVDVKSSRPELEEARKLLNSAAESGLAGTWHAELDLNEALFSNYRGIQDLSFDSTPVIVPATLTFTDDGSYMICFDKASLDAVHEDIDKIASKAAGKFLTAKASGASKLVVKAIDDSLLDQILSLLEADVTNIFSSGLCGSYSVNEDTICFSGEYSCKYELGETLRFTGEPGGIMSFLTAGDVEFTR